MKKKKFFTFLAVIIVLAIPFTVFAATSDNTAAKAVRGFFGIDASKLTDEQKADVADYNQKMADLQKDFINKMVENGAITREQGDAAIKIIDDRLANGGDSALPFGFGNGKGSMDMHDKSGGFVKSGIDTSKLTDEQKADLAATCSKMAELQKELISKMVSNGLMTSEQGDSATKKIDEIMANFQQNGLSKGVGMFMRGFIGFNCFEANDINNSKLTDQQKADFADYTTKMSELRKELTDKLVSYGLITAQQAEAFSQNNAEKGAFRQEHGMLNKQGMLKGNSGNRGMSGSASQSNSNSPVMQ